MKNGTVHALALSSMLAGCAYNPAPVALEGRAADLEALAGEWAGEYHGANGQKGDVVEGTYTLYTEGSPVPASGTWKVRRKRA